MSQQAHLIYMANQIARNLAAMGDDIAAKATADHIASFWDRRMKEAILADGSGLSPIAAAAVELLRHQANPPHVTRATRFDEEDGVDRADAG